MEIDAQKKRIVIEHLLEVGDHPRLIDGVPRKATAQLVIDPTPGHRIARALGHHESIQIPCPSDMAQQELEQHGRRELRRSPEAAISLIE